MIPTPVYAGPAHDPMSCLRTHLNSAGCCSSSGHGVQTHRWNQTLRTFRITQTFLSFVFLPCYGRMTTVKKNRMSGQLVSGKPSRVHRWGKKAQRFFNLYYSFWAQGGSQLRRDANLTRSRKTLPASLMGENCGWDFFKVKRTYRCVLQWTQAFLWMVLSTSLPFLLVILFQYHSMLWRVLGTNSRCIEKYYLHVASKCWNGDWNKESQKKTRNKCK